MDRSEYKNVLKKDLPVLIMKEFNLFQYLKAPQQFVVVFPEKQPVLRFNLEQTYN